jgi:hypothetical protein
VSLSLISSWESAHRPVKPPLRRLRQYALFFATRRSVAGVQPRLLRDEELTPAEDAERDSLYSELARLRDPDDVQPVLPAPGLRLADPGDAIGGGPYHFADKRPVTIVCARLPEDQRRQMPHVEPKDLDYVRSYSYADIDALIEIFGHIRAINPTIMVNIRTADTLESDDYTAHLVLLGGVDWNSTTAEIVRLVELPLLPRPRDLASDDGHFEVVAGPDPGKRFSPVVEVEGA